MTIKINGKQVRFLSITSRGCGVDAVTAKHTGFANFAELLNAKGNYRPSIYLGGKSTETQRELLFLSLQYNLVQQNRQDPRRVFKGDWECVTPHLIPLMTEN